MRTGTIITLLVVFGSLQLGCTVARLNYDESRVPDYTLPEVLETRDGTSITEINEWYYQRRPEILQLFEEHVYGEIPDSYDAIEFIRKNENRSAMGGEAILREVDIKVTRNGNSITIGLKMFLPNNLSRPLPVTLLLNHRGREYMDLSRRTKREFWPAEYIVDRGYVAAVFDVADVAPDDPQAYSKYLIEMLYPEQLEKPDGMRAISAWAWGAIRVMDYFMSDPDIDHQRSLIIGHSRGGKAALWTGARDERWSITVSNESGAGGAALSRRKFGATIRHMTNSFPYWFTPNFVSFRRNEDALPLDQHMLIASIAPRSVYVASAAKDKRADPKGEYLSLYHGAKVYEELYGVPVPFTQRIPPTNKPVYNSFVGYHLRDGKHDLKLKDWRRFLNFADIRFDLVEQE